MLKESVAVGRKALFEVQKSRGAEIVALAARGVQAARTQRTSFPNPYRARAYPGHVHARRARRA